MTRPVALGVTLAIAFVAACGGRGATRASDVPAPVATTPTTTSATASSTTTPTPTVDLCPYRDLGTWVDVYDYVPAFAEHGRVAPITPDAVATMKAQGVHTLYLQVAKDDPRSPGIITDEARASAFLERAHAAGLRVVAWYLPTHRDPQLDLQRALALVHFGAGGQHFDGVALDMEGVQAVVDASERNRRLLALVDALDREAGAVPIGAIVYPPIAFDVINPGLWPGFPWKEIAPHVDVWLPMAYWTFRQAGTPYRDASRYTAENVRRLRDHVGDPHAPVHVIGGIADTSTLADDEGFRRAATREAAIGLSVYDFNTTSPSAWPSLRVPSTC